MARKTKAQGGASSFILMVGDEGAILVQMQKKRVIRMFKVGVDSGNMNDALVNIKFFYDREVSDSVDSMVGMISPALTIVMGGLIFWVIAAVFGPLYQSFANMKF